MTRTYTPPDFNLFANVWRAPNAPPALSTDQVPCQLYLHSRNDTDIVPGNLTQYAVSVWIRCPMGTNLIPSDVVEVAAGDGWFYTVRFVDRVHRGFPNEYLAALLEQRSGTPPGAPPIGPPPGPTGFIAMESTGYVLQENGSRILLG